MKARNRFVLSFGVATLCAGAMRWSLDLVGFGLGVLDRSFGDHFSPVDHIVVFAWSRGWVLATFCFVAKPLLAGRPRRRVYAASVIGAIVVEVVLSLVPPGSLWISQVYDLAVFGSSPSLYLPSLEIVMLNVAGSVLPTILAFIVAARLLRIPLPDYPTEPPDEACPTT